MHRVAHGGCNAVDDFPLRHALFFAHDLTYGIDPTLGVGECAVLFKERGPRQENVGERSRLVQE